MDADTFMDLYAWMSLSVMGMVVVGGGVSIIHSYIQFWRTGRELKRLQRRRDELVYQLLSEPNGHPHHIVEESYESDR